MEPEGRRDARHVALIETMDCDVLLLTEISDRLALPAYDVHLSQQPMMPGRRWTAVAYWLPAQPRPDPHGASAMVELEGLRVGSTVLPRKGCGTPDPWAARPPQSGPVLPLPQW